MPLQKDRDVAAAKVRREIDELHWRKSEYAEEADTESIHILCRLQPRGPR